jgi:pyruvate-formate lyase-activating enzyme
MSKTFCRIPFRQIATFNDNHFHHCYAAIPNDADLTDFAQFAIKKENGTTFKLREDTFLEVWNSEWYKKLRLDLVNNIQNPACKQCWDRENIGAYSSRIKEISDVQDINKELINMNDDGSMKIGPKYLEVRTGNFCNLKCIACHPINSSEIVKEVNLWRTILVEVPQHVDMPPDSMNKIDKSFNRHDLVNAIDGIVEGIEEIQFYGGEPLVTHEVARFLDNLISLGREKFIKIKIVTNLTINNNKILDKLENFKEVEIIVSWDHVDPMKSHFIRFPQDYEKFLENFDRILKHPTYNIKLSPTISVFNIYDIPQIYDHFEKLNQTSGKQIKITSNILEIPKYFCIAYLNKQQKKEISALIGNYIQRNYNYSIFENGTSSSYNTLLKLRNLMNSFPDDYEDVIIERTKVLKLYDKTRSTDSKTLFPYLYD